MKRTIEQNKALYALLHRLNLLDFKEELVFEYTSSRTSKSSEMTRDECEMLIKHLRKHLMTYKPADQREALLDKKRKRVISHLKEAGFVLADGSADMHAIYSWVKRQKFKKSLNKHNERELSSLIYASNQVLKHFQKRFNDEYAEI